MIWRQMLEELKLPNEQKVFDLLKRKPADPVIYVIRVQDSIGLDAKDYYKILMKKYEEDGNKQFYKVVREYDYMLRDDRDRMEKW